MPTVRLLGFSDAAAARVRAAVEEASPESIIEVGVDAESETARLLRELLHAVGEATHAVNNPLTVISGNAQLAVELARAFDVDASVLDAVRDIDEAAVRLAETLLGLDRLKQHAADLTRGSG